MPVLSLAWHLPHNTPHKPSRYNNEQTTKQTKAINNSYIYKYYISCKCDTNRAGHFTLDAYASRPVACSHSVLVVMVNIGTVVIIGTVFWWSWTTLAQWTSETQCFGGHGQQWHSGHHWHSVLVVMVNIGTVLIIGTVLWWS